MQFTEYNENILGKWNCKNRIIRNNVQKKFNNKVDFTGNKYQVKLPHKKNHEIRGDNFEVGHSPSKKIALFASLKTL